MQVQVQIQVQMQVQMQIQVREGLQSCLAFRIPCYGSHLKAGTSFIKAIIRYFPNICSRKSVFTLLNRYNFEINQGAEHQKICKPILNR